MRVEGGGSLHRHILTQYCSQGRRHEEAESRERRARMAKTRETPPSGRPRAGREKIWVDWR